MFQGIYCEFTVTPASLQSQALSAILKFERPDIDRKRNEILRLQSEQSAKLRELEESLLNKISAVQGGILDDDSVINSLESLKKEAADVNSEVLRTTEVYDELLQISAVYEPVAGAMTSVFFTLQSLSDINPLYQFSLAFFLSIISDVLTSLVVPPLPSSLSTMIDTKENMKRLKLLSSAFFTEISRRVLRSLKFDDRLLFVARLAQIAAQGISSDDLSTVESDLLYRGVTPLATGTAVRAASSGITSIGFDDLTMKRLNSISMLPVFKNLFFTMNDYLDDWKAFVMSQHPEDCVPMQWLSNPLSVNDRRISLLKLILIQALRPDCILGAIESFVKVVFNDNVNWREQTKIDLKEIVKDSKKNIPIMICSAHGHDASGYVDTLASSIGKPLLQIAMGSVEAYAEADKLIAQAVRSGPWVLLRNVHLCIEWLTVFEKRLHPILASVHDNFRLFISCEIHPKLPAGLLLMSEVLVFEPSTGVKANLQAFYTSISVTRIDRPPTERSRLYGLVAWFHAVVRERLRYTPLGWTKKYEFTETDASFALDVIDQWVTSTAGSRTHVDPETLPWQAIQTLLSESIFGGRIDNPFDQKAMDSFIKSIFNPSKYASGVALVTDCHGASVLTLPDDLNRQVRLHNSSINSSLDCFCDFIVV
jgi:dynein heavy chain 1